MIHFIKSVTAKKEQSYFGGVWNILIWEGILIFIKKIVNHGRVKRKLNLESGGPGFESCFCLLPDWVTLGESLNY